MAVYFDSSALVKLAIDERESQALREYVRQHPRRVSSVLIRVELTRAIRRHQPEALPLAGRILQDVRLLDIDDTLLARAATVDPPEVRSLDAIHIAAALTLEDELDAFVTYDRRMAEAAQAAGLRVEAPAP
ncbi:MAG: type II toxin-antitoxin system VapC family toxin [Dehalococcoidia bacterium]